AAVDVARTERGGIVAAHAADAPEVEVLEERQRLSAVAAPGAGLAVQHERDVAGDREERLVLVGRLPVLEIARLRGELEVSALDAAARRPDRAVARVANPARGLDHRLVLVAELALEVEETLRAEHRVELQLGALEGEAEEQRVVLREGHAEAHAAAERG